MICSARAYPSVSDAKLPNNSMQNTIALTPMAVMVTALSSGMPAKTTKPKTTKVNTVDMPKSEPMQARITVLSARSKKRAGPRLARSAKSCGDANAIIDVLQPAETDMRRSFTAHLGEIRASARRIEEGEAV